MDFVKGVAEVPTPTVIDEKDLVVRVEAAPINSNDIRSVGRLARYGGVVFAAGEVASTVAVPLPQALASAFKADGDKKLIGGEVWVWLWLRSPSSGSSVEACRSRGGIVLRAMHQDQAQQSHVRSAAGRRASVFVNPLRCLVSPTHRAHGRHIAVRLEVVSSCTNARTTKERGECRAASETSCVRRPSVGDVADTSAVGRGCSALSSVCCSCGQFRSATSGNTQPSSVVWYELAVIDCDTLLTSACWLAQLVSKGVACMVHLGSRRC